MRKNIAIIALLGAGAAVLTAAYCVVESLRQPAISPSPQSTPAIAKRTRINRAAGPGQIILGAARFTVITAQCIRLEYSPHNGFVDERTLFADNRAARFLTAKIVRTKTQVIINTGQMRLIYRPNGQPFSAANLKVTFANGTQPQSWQPGQINKGNLGGPISTLDGVEKPINLPPGLISRDGWALVDDSGKAVRKASWIASRPGGGPDEKGVMAKNRDFDWYFFAYGQNYRSALQSLKVISGRAPLPRKAVLGSWYSRWHRYNANDFQQIVREYSAYDFPLDILVMDMDWHTQNATPTRGHPGWTGYTWNRELIPDPEKLLRELKQQGISVALNDHPADGIRDHEEAYPQFMKWLGQTPAKGNNLRFNAGDKKYMKAFFEFAHAPQEKQGVDFWWLDWQQDRRMPWVPGVEGLRHLPWLNELYFKQSAKDGLRGQSYSRWGGWGDHRNPIHFSGDTKSNWDVLAFEVPFTAASGNAGCFFWAHDTGGFAGARDPEMLVRWTQFSALSAALRLHSSGGSADRRPWLWGKRETGAMRAAHHLRSQLLPYIYTSARQSYDQMLPLLRPMYLAYPNREPAYHASSQYLLGDNLLVAPIVTPGVGPGWVGRQSVWFPAGTWHEYSSGEPFQGGQEKLVTAALDEIPLYVRGGVPIPLQPYTPRMTSAPLTQLRVQCYPGEDGKTGVSQLYEDDGRTAAYQNNGFARTPLSYARKGNEITVKIGASAGHYRGQVLRRSIVIELPSTQKATRVRIKGRAISFQYNAATFLNRIVIPARSIRNPISIAITCAPADCKLLHDRSLLRRIQGITGKRPASASFQHILAALKGAPSPQQEMALATLGIGVMRKVDGPNFRDELPRWYFYAPSGVLSKNEVKLYDSDGIAQQKVVTGQPLFLRDSKNLPAPIAIEFRLGDRVFRQNLESMTNFSSENNRPEKSEK